MLLSIRNLLKFVCLVNVEFHHSTNNKSRFMKMSIHRRSQDLVLGGTGDLSLPFPLPCPPFPSKGVRLVTPGKVLKS